MTRFFITRPENQAFELMQKLEAQNPELNFEHWPIFNIQDLELTGQAQSWLYNFDEYDYVFVASKHAANLLLGHLDERWPMLPLGPEFVCPGSGTASAFSHTQQITSYPNTQMDSDAVIKMSMFTDEALATKKKWLLVSGNGGRRKVNRYLKEHDQQIDELNLYKRNALQQLPEHSVQSGDVVVVTSRDTLEQVEWLLKNDTQKLNLWVCSERIKEKAKNWQSISIIPNALDQTILQAVNDYE